MRFSIAFLGLLYSSSSIIIHAQALNALDALNIDERSLLVDGFVDTDACYAALEEAATSDTDPDTADRGLTRDEYAFFVQGLGPEGIFDGRDTFASLPLVIRSNFNVLACFCTQTKGARDDCCEGDNAVIQTLGAFAADTPAETTAQQAYLFLVCSLTSLAIDRVLESQPPSAFPTAAPSVSPTASPTAAPSVSPTPGPTAAPSISPTVSPTLSPGPTATPSVSPTASPTPPGVIDLVVTASYDIIVFGGGDDSDIATPETELIAAMDSLAPEVLLGAAGDRNRNRKLLRSGRRLQAIQLPTSIDARIAIDCPPDLTAAEDRCESVTASMRMLFQPGDNSPGGTRDNFEQALQEAIEDGDLQDALDIVNIDSVAFILTGANAGTITKGTGAGGDDNGISGGGVAGIVIGAASAFFLVAIFMAIFARRERVDKMDRDTLAPAPQHMALDEGGDYNHDDDDEGATMPVVRQQQQQQQDKKGSSAVLGATSPNYGNKTKPKQHPPPMGQMVMDKDMEAMSDHGHGDDSSNAGSSGWSSSAGVSSLNTGSADGLDDPVAGMGMAAGGATLAVMAGATALRRTSDSEKSDTHSSSSVSRSDLDNAIEAGDWAAVGATAALLAAASDSQSFSSRSGHMSGSVSRSGTSVSSLDAARAAELDHLVDAGDWEGVVLAAAKYEAAESPHSGTTGSVASGSDSRSASITGSGTYPSVSAASAASESQASSPSKAKKREELRSQVEELVRRVVPEEIENVDEMMLQFRGREEELVETLRTMQERAVAQKARQGAQKAAKIVAKRSVTEARSAPPGNLALADSQSVDDESEVPSHYLPANVQSMASGQVTDRKSSGGPKGTSLGVGYVEDAKKKPSDRDQTQSLLEQAIEAGDWEAVGEAAALMSDASNTSADSSEINRLAEGLSSVTSSKSGSRGPTAQRAAELDKLVDKGDWAGVVAAASRYNQDDEEEQKPTKTKSWFGKQQQLKEQEEKRQKRLKRMQEEQDALAQAEIWMAIAEQTKQENEKEAPGASDAADWAIAKSLSLLVKAEQDGQLQGTPPRGAAQEDDEEEV